MWLLMLACSGPAEPPLDAALFTEEVARQLEARLTRYEVAREGPLVLKVTSPDGFEQELRLERLFEDCSSQRARCEEARIAWVERQGRNAQTRAEPFRLALLRPRLMRAEEARSLELPSQPWQDGLVVVPSLDAPSSSRGVTQAELEAEGFELEPGLQQALVLMKQDVEELELEPLEGGARVVYSPRAADLLLVERLWSEGQLVLAAQPELLLVGEDPEALRRLADELADPEAPRLSEQVYAWSGTNWQAR